MTKTKTIFDFLPFDTCCAEQTIALNAMQVFVGNDDKDDFLILSGAAGTGKTSVTSALINYMADSQALYHICAPTGRAARILGRKTGKSSETIHSLIYIPEVNDDGIITWKLKLNTTDKKCVFIIDEASMIAAVTNMSADGMFLSANVLLDDLASFIKSGNSENKIVFLGDDRQLPPVDEYDSKALNADYLRNKYSWNGSAYELKEVIRQKCGSYILDNAVKIRESINNNEPMPMIKANRYRSAYEAATVYARNFEEDNGQSAVCIARSHKQNNSMNAYIRALIFGGMPKLIVPGDLMIVNRNWKRLGCELNNGDAVTVLSVDWAGAKEMAGLTFVPVRIAAKDLAGNSFEVDELLLLDILTNENHQLTAEQAKRLMGERMRINKTFRESKKASDDAYVGALHLVYGHSITCHKAQGGEWNRVYLNTFGVREAKWMYTAVTRAQHILEII